MVLYSGSIAALVKVLTRDSVSLRGYQKISSSYPKPHTTDVLDGYP